jgi:hypothetical protein
MPAAKLITLTTTLACAASLGACAMGGTAYSPRLQTKASDERAFATTFASCRDQVRAGKSDGFKLSSAGPSARDFKPGATGLMLKVPYDKAKGGSRAARAAQDATHKASMDRCLGENGYQVAGWDARGR